MKRNDEKDVWEGIAMSSCSSLFRLQAAKGKSLNSSVLFLCKWVKRSFTTWKTQMFFVDIMYIYMITIYI